MAESLMVPDRNSIYRKALDAIAAKDVGFVMRGELMSRHSSWKIGGAADLFVEPYDSMQIVTIVKSTAEFGIPLIVIGNGSNLLFDDAGIRGVVMKIGSRMAGFSASDNRLIVDASIWVPLFARKTCQSCISGFEHTIGIPGTLGGLVLMNGGSQRKSVGESVKRVWGITRAGDEKCIQHNECGFSYRHSALRDSGLIVVRIELEGIPGDCDGIRREMLDILKDRRKKFPLKQPNCGSVFLSTSELHGIFGPPGKIIETAGLKGMRIGDAQISQKHANFIVNLGSATARDTLDLITKVKDIVLSRTGAELLTEVLRVSENGVIGKIA